MNLEPMNLTLKCDTSEVMAAVTRVIKATEELEAAAEALRVARVDVTMGAADED